MNNIVSGIMGNTLRRYLIIALVASLAVTGGMFAYAYTTSSTTITATGSADYADIGAYSNPPTYSIFGGYRGALPTGYLFSVNLTSGYPGDVAVNVYLDNIDQLGKNYGLWLMRLELVQASDNASMDIEGNITRPITLNNGVVTFVSANMTSGTEYRVRCDGGVYKAFPWAYINAVGGTVSPSFTAEVLQAQ
ncbi:MAG: hypothetical protein WBB97_04345 [Dehalococcoidales bacterium]